MCIDVDKQKYALICYAATCFRNAKQLDLCKDALMKAADCHKQNRGLFHAARCYEQVCLYSVTYSGCVDLFWLPHFWWIFMVTFISDNSNIERTK